MSYTIPQTEPTKLRAGDSLIFKKQLAEYDSPTWTLTYYVRGPKKIDITATQDGSSSGFSVSVAAATTAGWLPGAYTWQAVVSYGSEKHTVATGRMQILANLGAVTDDNYDPRSPAKIALDAIDAVLAGSASRVQKEYEIDGVRIADKPIEELIRLRDHFKALVSQENSLEDIEAGRPGRRKILTRFV